MAVTFVDATTGPVAEGISTTVLLPPRAAAGDLILPALYIDEPDAIGTPGWSVAGSVWNAAATFGEHVWAVPFAGFGSGVLSWRTRTWHDWLAIAFRGHDPAAPINRVSSATGSGRVATAPSIRTTVDGCLLVLIACANGDANADPPTGWAEPVDTGDGHYAAVAATVQERAGDTGPIAATFTRSWPWTAMLLAIAPAPAVVEASGSATIDLSASIAATGAKAISGTTSMGAVTDVAAAGRKQAAGIAESVAAATLTADGAKHASGSASIEVTLGVEASGRRGRALVAHRALAQADDATLRVLALDGTWETCGVDTAVGVVPESLQLHADRRGPSTASFDLRRRADAIWPDCAAWAPLVVEIGGVVRWRGYAGETPIRDAGAETVISVQCRGLQYDLDADVYRRDYVHTRLADWRDQRSFPSAVLGFNAAYAAGVVGSEGGAITLSMPKGQEVGQLAAVGVVLDLGDAQAAASIAIEYEGSANADVVHLYVRSSDAPDWRSGTVSGDAATSSVLGLGARGTLANHFPVPRRYVHLFIYNTLAGHVPGADITIKVKSVKVFTDTSYRAGSGSALKASTVLNDALNRTVHSFSPDRSRIAVTDYNIPDLAPRRFVTVGEIGQAVNAWHNRVLKVDLHDRLVFQPRPTAPEIEIGAWPGSTFLDSSANSGEGIHNRAIVEGTGHDGTPTVVVRDSAEALGNAAMTRPAETAAFANPSFDTNTTGWRLTNAGAGTLSRDATRSNSPPAAARVDTPGIPGFGGFDLHGDLTGTLIANRAYALRFTSTASVARAAAGWVYLRTLSDSLSAVLGEWAAGAAGVWGRTAFVIRPDTNINLAALRFHIQGTSYGASVWFDSFEIVELIPTVADRRGRREPKIIQPSFPISTEAGVQLADTFLRGHATTPLRGEAEIGVGGARHVLGGHDEHPAGLLARTGELLGLSHRTDPDTGGVGRHGEIATVTYMHRDRKSTVAIDDNRGNFDALVARLDAIQGAG